ncbi:hypothetical protein Dimus_022821, partial [Dionaea muscipula]
PRWWSARGGGRTTEEGDRRTAQARPWSGDDDEAVEVRLAWGTTTFGYNQPITVVGGGRMGSGGGIAGGERGVVACGGVVAFEELVFGAGSWTAATNHGRR